MGCKASLDGAVSPWLTDAIQEGGGIWRAFLVPLLPNSKLKFASVLSAGRSSTLALELGSVAVSPRAQWGSYKQERFLENAVFLSAGLPWTTVVLHVLETLITMSCSCLSRISTIARFVLRHNFREVLMPLFERLIHLDEMGKRWGCKALPQVLISENLCCLNQCFLKKPFFSGFFPPPPTFKKVLVKLLV